MFEISKFKLICNWTVVQSTRKHIKYLKNENSVATSCIILKPNGY